MSEPDEDKGVYAKDRRETSFSKRLLTPRAFKITPESVRELLIHHESRKQQV